MKINSGVLVAAVCVGVLATQGTARATPYAYATNQISNLTLTLWNGTADVLLPVTQTNPSDPSNNYASGSQENVYATSSYNGYPPASFSAFQSIPIYPTISALNVPQAFSGTGTIPGDNTFGQAGPGTFDGTRSDSMIGAGAAPHGAISVANVAEGNVTNGGGNSQGNNTATLAYTITITTPGSVHLAYEWVAALIASTTQAGESANAAIANSFSIQGLDNTFFESAPLGVIASANRGVVLPSTLTYSDSGTIDWKSSVLGTGTYQISLSSSASQNVIGVPEPASLALLGAGLIGLGLMRRRHRAG